MSVFSKMANVEVEYEGEFDEFIEFLEKYRNLGSNKRKSNTRGPNFVIIRF